MPDRVGQGGQRRRADRADARFYVRRRPAYCSKPVEGGRSGHQRADEAILSRNARARSVERGRGVTSSSDVDLEREAVASAILLGRLRPPGRVEIAMNSAFIALAAKKDPARQVLNRNFGDKGLEPPGALF